MKKLLVALTIAIATFLSAPVEAQTRLTETSLSANVAAADTVIRLASATNVQAGGALFVDHEYMPILSVSGTSATVARVQRPMAHASSSVVYVATAAQRPVVMLSSQGAQRSGACSTSTSFDSTVALAAYRFLPLIDIDTGNIYDCLKNGVGGAWVWNVVNRQTTNGIGSFVTYSADAAIALNAGTVYLTKGSAGAYTVAAPGAANIGKVITFTTGSAFAHVVTFTGGTLWDGTAGANTTWTAAAVQGSSLTVVATSATTWNVVSFNLGTIAP